MKRKNCFVVQTELTTYLVNIYFRLYDNSDINVKQKM